MPSPFDYQTTDRVNSQSFGTTKLSENQGEFIKANKVNDGGASAKGKKEPADNTGTR